MNGWVAAVLLATLASISHAEPFKKYDAEDVRRLADELRRMGVVLKSLTKPDEPLNLPPPIVSAPAGDFEGYWSKTQFGRNYAAFEGIPYAQPPVGHLRFKLAQPLNERLEHFQAKAPGSMCLQRNLAFNSPSVEGQEDCLFINVYSPIDMTLKSATIQRSKSERLPVVFWIHGGGLFTGEGAMFQPQILLDQQVVLVTFNYRLGPLGFLTTEDGVIPSNIGLKDQVEALRWVHNNIDAFGGDPNLVTIFGQSSGGASAEFHTLSPLSRGLFHRAISSSGQALAPWALAPSGETARNRKIAADYWGCNSKPSAAFLECLIGKTAEDITAVDYTFTKWGIFPVVPFRAVIEGDIDGAFLPLHPLQHYADGNFNDVPYMSGINSDDGGFYALGIFTNNTQLEEFDANFNTLLPLTIMLDDRASEKTKAVVAESFRRAYFPPGPLKKAHVGGAINIFTDTLLLYPLIKERRERIQLAKSATFTWLFSYKGNRSFSKLLGDPNNAYGVSHSDDLIYLFNSTALFGEDKPTARDVWMSIFMTEIYANFAKYGKPSSTLTDTVWKPSTGYDEKLDYLNIVGPEKITMETNMLPERWRFVEEITKIIQQAKSASNRDH